MGSAVIYVTDWTTWKRWGQSKESDPKRTTGLYRATTAQGKQRAQMPPFSSVTFGWIHVFTSFKLYILTTSGEAKHSRYAKLFHWRRDIGWHSNVIFQDFELADASASLQYGSGTDPTFSYRGLVQKLPVGISTKESHSDFWHHLLRKNTSVICNTIAEHSLLRAVW